MNERRREQRTVLVVGQSRPHTGGIPTVLQDQFSCPLAEIYNLVLFDTRKRTREGRTLIEGVVAQMIQSAGLMLKLLTLRPDLVHIHAGGGSDIFRKGFDVLIAKMCRRRVLLHIHGGDFDRFFATGCLGMRNRIQRIFRRCNGIVALSDYWKGLYCEITEATKVHVVNNCVDVALYLSLDRDKARLEMNLPAHPCIVLHLGSQGTRKGTFDLLRAVPLVLQRHPATLFLFVGPDEDVYEGAIREGLQLAAELGVSHAVRFLGARTGREKLNCLGAADLLVLPSHAENFPLSVLEAMAAGLPVVSTNVGGIPDIFDEVDRKKLVEPGDVSSLAQRILEYTVSDKLRRGDGEKNRGRARDRFDKATFARNLDDVYQATCGLR